MMARGGKRTGAGRPKYSYKSPTKVIRCDVAHADLIQSGALKEILGILADWDEGIGTASKTSPRWQKAREMINEINQCLEEKGFKYKDLL